MASVKVIIPAVMASATMGDRELNIDGSNVSDVGNALSDRYGEPFQRRVLDAGGKLRSVLNFYVNGKNIKFLNNLDTELSNGDEVMFLPAVSGG